MKDYGLRTPLQVGRVVLAPWRGPAFRDPVTLPHPKGWECPRCNKVWAPDVKECAPCNKGKAKRRIVTK